MNSCVTRNWPANEPGQAKQSSHEQNNYLLKVVQDPGRILSYSRLEKQNPLLSCNKKLYASKEVKAFPKMLQRSNSDRDKNHRKSMLECTGNTSASWTLNLLSQKQESFTAYSTRISRVVKGIFVTRDQPFFFPVKCEMANFYLVNRDFLSSREAWLCKIIFRETRNKCLIRREPWFSLCLCYFRQPLLRNKWYCVTVTGRLILVATTWLVWSSVTFGQPSFSSSVSSISTIMTEAPQRECPRWPRSSTRTTGLNGFTKPPSIRLVLFLWTCIRLLSTGENG